MASSVAVLAAVLLVAALVGGIAFVAAMAIGIAVAQDAFILILKLLAEIFGYDAKPRARIRLDAPLDVACLVSCGVLAGAGPVFNRAKVPPGASVAVFGCGGVGLNTVQAARMVGAGKIIAVDVNRQKLEWAEEFGATHAVDASKEDPVARVQAISGMGGVDFAFEVVGTQKTIEQALASTHRGGTCVVVGVSPAGTRLSIDPTMFLQQRILTGTSFGGGHQRTDVPLLLDLYKAGTYKLDELISRRLPLAELNQAFELMLQGDVKRSVIVYE